MSNNLKVYVGLSGGVDSAVSAYLLKKQGYNVTGVYMKNWSGEDFGIEGDCPWEEEVKDAESVANHLGIEFKIYNFEKEYREKVVNYFFEEYSKGLTPNPDIMCNKAIKFDDFLKKCISDGADKIATGHYARIFYNNNRYSLHKGIDSTKDQSYFLCALNEYQLSKSIFPVGVLEKTEVRKIAKEAGIPVYAKKDSQGICFIGKINVSQFLRDNIAYHEGDIIDFNTNEVIGKHDGVAYYTIGQRQGLNRIVVSSPSQKPYYISSKDIDKNILYVVQGDQDPALFTNYFHVKNLKFISNDYSDQEDFDIVVRYRQRPVPGKVKYVDTDSCNISLSTSIRAVTEGQTVALYIGDECAASGTIG